MGTNYYFRSEDDEFHIGKRSAAGMYCWDCRLTLCLDEEEGIHSSHSNWDGVCPRCMKKPEVETLASSAPGQILGFAKDTLSQSKGVRSVCSFNWAIKPQEYERLAYISQLSLVDEYGNKYTPKQFQQMLKYNCPIRFYGSIGTEFS